MEWTLLPVGGLALVLACAGRQPASVPPSAPQPVAAPAPGAVPARPAVRAPDPCRIAGSGSERRLFVLAASDPIDPSAAPIPTNGAERIAFRQLYGTLARRDCTGRIEPWLAARIVPDSGGRVWLAQLADITSPDGTPITAAIVLDQWRQRVPGGPVGVAAMRAVDERTLAVTLVEPADSVPALFADPTFAVAGSRAANGWPATTGNYEIDAVRAGAAAGASSLSMRPRQGMDQPAIEFRAAGAADPRDLLDQGADLVVTRDPAAIAYARADSGVRAVPLAWDRVYVLAGAGEPDSSGAMSGDVAAAVRAEARAARGAYWWGGGGACRAAAQPATRRAGRILYPRGDVTARDLAERLVALAALPARYPHLLAALGHPPVRLTAVAATPDELRDALQRGTDAGYVVALPRLAPAACTGAVALPAGMGVTPLVETRAYALVRRGAPGAITLDGDGGLRVTGALPDSVSP